MRELGPNNSLQLLCWHVFGLDAPSGDYEQLLWDILSLTRGVPWAIEVIGSHLRGRSMLKWEETLNKLKKVPLESLYREILMPSYEKLDEEEKEILLDIVFFFADQDETIVFYYWEACGIYPKMSVDTLISYAPVKIDDSNRFQMHGLLKDLGREVARK
ncbi:hypothetical protein MLD38_035447 [Melastoma candidum]|uniref:Uncharacterized protein n=1 Tax=Melastoma candidum TaxID=119954 RepID=A0ACB9LGN8_9MYRT|nr:hypothetical protein MLD38_035447 [Melastoma candidum]